LLPTDHREEQSDLLAIKCPWTYRFPHRLCRTRDRGAISLSRAGAILLSRARTAAFGSLIGRQVISRRRAIAIDYNSKCRQERFLFVAANNRDAAFNDRDGRRGAVGPRYNPLKIARSIMA